MITGKQNMLEVTHISCSSYIAKWDAFFKVDVVYLVAFSGYWLRWFAVYVPNIGKISKKLDGIDQAVACVIVGGRVFWKTLYRLEREKDLISRESIVFWKTKALGQWPFRPLQYLEGIKHMCFRFFLKWSHTEVLQIQETNR